MSSSNSKTTTTGGGGGGGGGSSSSTAAAARRQKSRAKRRSPRREAAPDPEPKKNAPRRLQNKLYIGGLAESVKKEDLELECSRFGKLSEVWLAHHPPGFAFVEFISNKDAADVIDAFDGKMLCGSKVRVEYAKANGPGNTKRQKRKESSKATAPATSLLERISPLLSISVPHRSLLTSGTNRNIPPLLSIVHSASPVRRREGVQLREMETLTLWDRQSSPTPLLPPPRYRNQVAIGRDRSPTSAYQDLMPPPLLSPSITRDLGRVYPLLPPPPPLPLLSSRSRNDSRERNLPLRDRSRSPVYIRCGSPPVLLPSSGRLLGRTPPPLSRERSLSLELRYSPRRSRAREIPRSRSPPVRKVSTSVSRSLLVDDRRMSPSSKYKAQSSSQYRQKHSPVSRRHSSPERTTTSNYLPRAYASPQKQRSPSSERQFQRTARLRKSLSRSPRHTCSHQWNQRARSRSPILQQNSSRSPSPKRYRCDAGHRLASRSPSNGRSASRRSFTPPVKRYSPIGPRSPPSMSNAKSHARNQSNRRSTSLDYLPARHSPKRYSTSRAVRSPPIVRSPSPYDNLASRRSTSGTRSPMMMRRAKSPSTGIRTPPQRYRQTSPRYRSPVALRGRRLSPYRSPVGSDRSQSLRRTEHRSSRNSPLAVKPRAYVRSPSRSPQSYRKGSPPVIRRRSPSSQSPRPQKRISPLRSRPMSPRNGSSYMRRRSSPSPSPPASRQNRNFGRPASPQMVAVASRRSRSRSMMRMSEKTSLRASKQGGNERRFSVNRSPSLRRSPPLSPCSRYSPMNKGRRASPLMKGSQRMYRSPSQSPKRSSSFYLKDRAESRRSPPPPSGSPTVLQRRTSGRRTPSSSPERKSAFSGQSHGHKDWSPPHSSQRGSSVKKHTTASSWDDARHYKSPKRKSISPPPASPPQHHRKHKSAKKLKT